MSTTHLERSPSKLGGRVLSVSNIRGLEEGQILLIINFHEVRKHWDAKPISMETLSGSYPKTSPCEWNVIVQFERRLSCSPFACEDETLLHGYLWRLLLPVKDFVLWVGSFSHGLPSL